MDYKKITTSRSKPDSLTTRTSKFVLDQENMSMTLEPDEAVKAVEEHIEILKQNLLFLMDEGIPKSRMMTRKIITIKKELDKAVQERMKLSQILLSS